MGKLGVPLAWNSNFCYFSESLSRTTYASKWSTSCCKLSEILTLLRQFLCQDFAYKIPVSSPRIQSVTNLHNLKENPNQPDKMSEWVVLDITSFTKTTKKDKILKILKDVSYSRIQSRTKSYHLRPRLMFARFLILTRVN